jgi:hypothetical protein
VLDDSFVAKIGDSSAAVKLVIATLQSKSGLPKRSCKC